MTRVGKQTTMRGDQCFDALGCQVESLCELRDLVAAFDSGATRQLSTTKGTDRLL
ncbi:MAG: hypothetical protein WBP11_05400 [Dokdonella sp.]